LIFQQEVHFKLNDNYKLVANLSAENFKLSGEKLKMESFWMKFARYKFLGQEIKPMR